jgi:AraC-like DNA-binding protein
LVSLDRVVNQAGHMVATSGTARDDTDRPIGHVRMWRAADLDGVLAITGTTAAYSADPRAGELIVGIIDEGGLQVRRARVAYDLSAGDVVIWDSSHPHAGVARGGPAWRSRLVVFETPWLDSVATGDRQLRELAFPRPVLRDPVVANAFSALHACVKQPTGRLERDAALMAFADRLLEHHYATRVETRARARSHPCVRRACEYLRAHLAENVGLAELATAAGTDRDRLTRLFRAATGTAPHGYLIAQRVSAARRMLEAGQPDIASIAAAAGFVDQSHLYRHFRRLLGVTPRVYARRFARPR